MSHLQRRPFSPLIPEKHIKRRGIHIESYIYICIYKCIYVYIFLLSLLILTISFLVWEQNCDSVDNSNFPLLFNIHNKSWDLKCMSTWWNAKFVNPYGFRVLGEPLGQSRLWRWDHWTGHVTCLQMPLQRGGHSAGCSVWQLMGKTWANISMLGKGRAKINGDWYTHFEGSHSMDDQQTSTNHESHVLTMARGTCHRGHQRLASSWVTAASRCFVPICWTSSTSMWPSLRSPPLSSFRRWMG